MNARIVLAAKVHCHSNPRLPSVSKDLERLQPRDLDEENLVEHTQFGVFPDNRQPAVDDGVALTTLVAIDDYYKSPFILERRKRTGPLLAIWASRKVA